MMLNNKRHQQNGSILMLAVLFATTLSIFSLTYYRVARETQSTDYRTEQYLLAREISRMIHEEAFTSLVRDGRKSDSQLFWFLLGAVSGVQTEIKLPFSRQNAAKLLPPGFACEFSCTGKVINFINNDPDGRRYSCRHEGHGVIALIIETTIVNEKNRLLRPVTHRLEIHHDYLVASMICADQYGSRLNKVLLTRKDRSFYDQSVFNGENATLIASQTEMLPPNQTPENIQTYNQYALWARRAMTPKHLSRLQIFSESTRTINISGINHCQGKIELNGPWKISGKGVLIADSFVINDAITKSKEDDLLVLYARKGKINVNTSSEVQAALIAINNSFTGTIEAGKPLNLLGLILTDRLNLNNWSSDEHKVTYDPVFKRSENAYQISFSPWVNFRMSSSR